MFSYIVMEHPRTAEKEICITGYTGEEVRVEVPERIDGLAVTGIGDYAFSGHPITHLFLPKTITHMGRYALYRCSSLRLLSFFGGLKDFGAGAFTGCHHIQQLILETDEDGTSGLRDVLMEVSEELQVEYRVRKDKAVLLFPEFFEEGVENTPARIIEHHTHGSGLLYRNCFADRKLRFQEYDDRFPYARGQEKDSFVLRLAVSRLVCPMGLSDHHRSIYEDYVKEHFEAAAALYSQAGDASTVSFLMNLRRSYRQPKELSFEL